MGGSLQPPCLQSFNTEVTEILRALRVKGLTVAELHGAARSLRLEPALSEAQGQAWPLRRPKNNLSHPSHPSQIPPRHVIQSTLKVTTTRTERLMKWSTAITIGNSARPGAATLATADERTVAHRSWERSLLCQGSPLPRSGANPNRPRKGVVFGGTKPLCCLESST